MQLRIRKSTFTKVISWICLILFSVTSQTQAEPWEEPQDTFSAIFTPDKYAWELFVSMNWPANVPAQEADPNKAFGEEGAVVWETWRNTRPFSDNTVFKNDGSDPGPWIPEVPVAAVERKATDFEPIPLKQQIRAMQQLILDSRIGVDTPVIDTLALRSGNEVRFNTSTYEFVRSAELYNIEGQVKHVNAGKLILDFPANSKTVKAQWRPIQEDDKPRYHWAEVDRDGVKEIWGLSALHITTKDIPNWFWATFEHIDNKVSGDSGDPGRPNLGWLTKSVDRHACQNPKPVDCEEIPAGMGLEDTKWENYRLRGTQIDFVTQTGETTILANSQIEASFQTTSSCITCHADAAVNKMGNAMGMGFPTGIPDSRKFTDPVTSERIWMQRDFLWSLSRAQNKTN